MSVILYCFWVLNTFAFILIGYDKYLAKAQKNRIPESILLGFVCIGGTIGSSMAMLFFKHKTAKVSYLSKFWGIVVLQLLLTFLWFYYNPFTL
jgi:uncharacterized membrane protein YsdA (DUF1294 family)